jgi:hypothetical protein
LIGCKSLSSRDRPRSQDERRTAVDPRRRRSAFKVSEGRTRAAAANAVAASSKLFQPEALVLRIYFK